VRFFSSSSLQLAILVLYVYLLSVPHSLRCFHNSISYLHLLSILTADRFLFLPSLPLTAAIFLIISSGLQTTSPLVTKELLKFITTAYTAARTPGVEVPPIGRGIGIAFGLFAMQQVASLCSNQYMCVPFFLLLPSLSSSARL
jgi:hypothetical protein